MAKWQEQFIRMRRYHDRLRRMYAGQPHRQGNEELVDDVYAFFLNCYHLKDWLIHDAAYVSHSKPEIEDYITNTAALALCADICNSIKHLSLSNSRSGAAPQFKGTHLIMDFGDDFSTVQSNPELPVITLRVNLEHAGQHVDALDLANDAVAAWETLVGSPPN